MDDTREKILSEMTPERVEACKVYHEKWKQACDITIEQLGVAFDALVLVDKTQDDEGFRIHHPFTGYLRDELKKTIDIVGVLRATAKGCSPYAEEPED